MATPANFNWVPSTARTVVLEGFGLVPRGTLPFPPQVLAWPVKDPADTLDYVFDLSEAFAGNDEDAIATLDVQISPANAGDLTLQSSAAEGTRAVLWLTQGVAGTTYAVTVTVGTQNGRVLARTVSLPVQALTAPAVPAAAITTEMGAPITDQSGDALTAS